jgi:hypothetical protein
MDSSSWQQWQNRIVRLFGNDFEATMDLPVSCHWSTSRLESLGYLAVREGWGAARSADRVPYDSLGAKRQL